MWLKGDRLDPSFNLRYTYRLYEWLRDIGVIFGGAELDRGSNIRLRCLGLSWATGREN